MKIQQIAPGAKGPQGCLYRLDFSLNSAIFKNLGCCSAHRVNTQSSQLLNSPVTMAWHHQGPSCRPLYFEKEKKNFCCLPRWPASWAQHQGLWSAASVGSLQLAYKPHAISLIGQTSSLELLAWVAGALSSVLAPALFRCPWYVPKQIFITWLILWLPTV